MPTHQHGGPHGGDHVHLDEADWEKLAAQTELEGQLLIGFVTETVRWACDLRGRDAAPVRQVLDIGSGPGVGTCELARLFPDAHIIAVDGSPAMLERTEQRAASSGLGPRIDTRLATLPDGLDGLEPVDLIWASMSLHHVGDEIAALRGLRELLQPSGIIAIAEIAEPMRVLPDELDVGRPGLADRLDAAGARWFAALREGLAGDGASSDLPTMLTAAGLDMAGSRLARQRFDAPLSSDARRVVLGHLRRARAQVELDRDDLCALDVLTDSDDRRGVLHRPDVFVMASRQIYIARPIEDR